MKVYITFGTASVGKDLFVGLFEYADVVDLVGYSREADRAIEDIQRERPQLVIVEEVLKIGWGIDVIHSIEKSDGFPAVIMISTLPPPMGPDEPRRENIDLWLQLPDDMDRLRETVGRLVTGDSHEAVMAWREQLAEERR
jgi:DNA-binding NtrC family response regulator